MGICANCCSAGYYPVRENDTYYHCYQCHPDCASCESHSQQGCTNCTPGQYLLVQDTQVLEGACVNNCSLGYFSEAIGEITICAECHSSCRSCVGEYPSNCTNCSREGLEGYLDI